MQSAKSGLGWGWGGTLFTTDGLRLGTHACCEFRDEAHERAVLRTYLVQGLARGEKVAYFGRVGSEDRPLDYLSDVWDVDAALARGQLTIGSVEAAYFPGGCFDGAARVDAFALWADAVVHQEGYSALRVYADNGWMPAALDDPLEWVAYELRVALMVPQHRLIGLCGFHQGEDGPLSFSVIDALHHHNMDGPVRPSSFFVHGGPQGSGLSVAGEIDFAGTEDLRVVLEQAQQIIAGQTLSLDEVGFLDAAGAETLYGALRSGADLHLRVSPIVARVCSLLGYDLLAGVGSR